MRKTKFAASLAALTLTTGILAACGGEGDAGDGSTTTVSVQTYPGIWTNVLVWVAEDQGFYADHGLKVKPVEIATGPQGLAALQGGSIDLAQSTSDNLMVSVSKGIDLKVVVGNFGDMYTLMASSRIDASGSYPGVVAGLKGTKIGVTAPGASTDLLAKSTVVGAGLAEKDVEYVAVGGTAGQVTAMSSKVVDSVVAMTPQETVFEETGDARPIVSYARGEGPAVIEKLNGCFQTYFGLSSWVEKNPEAAKAFAAAHRDAEKWANDPANTEALAKLLQSKAPIAGVDDPSAVALKATKRMVEAGQITTNATADCLSNWSGYLKDAGVLKSDISGADVLWSGASK